MQPRQLLGRIQKGCNQVRKAIATLLSFCMMFSIMAQVSVARAEEMPGTESGKQYLLQTQTSGQSEDTALQDAEPRAASSETALEPEAPVQTDAAEDTTPAAEDAAALTLDEEEEQFSQPEQISGVEVCVLSGLPLQRDVEFTVRLAREGEEAAEKTLTLSADAQNTTPSARTVRFDGLENGRYTLAVSGSGFETYTQTIEVKDLVYSVQLYTGFLAGFTYSASDVHPGVLRIGDADGSGTVDQADIDAVIDAMEAGENSTACDLDGSGTVDLTDLQMLAESYQDTRDNLAAVVTRIPEALSKPSTNENTVIESGSLEDLTNGNATLSLQNTASEPISPENPVEISFDFAASRESVPMEGMVLQTPADSDNAVSGAVVTVEYVDPDTGLTETMELMVGAAVTARAAAAQVRPDGSVVLDFGGQIAVKKITITVTATANSTNLAEISKVEFLNDMESHIPAPEMNIPTGLKAEPGSRNFTLTWNGEVNITGYEVRIRCGDREEILRTSVNSLTVTTFGGEKLTNGTEYTVSVQSVNGEWRSGYSDTITVVPKADKLPTAPDALRLTGRFQRIEASWAAAKDADSYNVYYRRQGDGDYLCETGVKATSFTIRNLENNAAYEVYVTAVNELGEGPASLLATASTANINPVRMPAYKLINTPESAGEVTSHIVNATHSAGYMKDSPLDSGNTAWGIVDGDFASWYGINDWDDGVSLR